MPTLIISIDIELYRQKIISLDQNVFRCLLNYLYQELYPLSFGRNSDICHIFGVTSVIFQLLLKYIILGVCALGLQQGDNYTARKWIA